MENQNPGPMATPSVYIYIYVIPVGQRTSLTSSLVSLTRLTRPLDLLGILI